ncbi:MAG: hypothetical protein NTY86_04605 [Deltaproteobacteria bacterium]|nr:hypothetical protein [Deltaproteobacteria bacterium]
MNILEQVEKIPWYWVGLFTSLLLLVISILVKKIDSNSYIIYYGGEYGAVAAALAQGRGFSDPFSIGSGATAWVSPLLPAIIGLIFYITSLKVTVAYWILLIIKIISLGFAAGLIWAVLQKSNRGFASVWYLWVGFLCYIHKYDLLYQYHDEWLIFLLIRFHDEWLIFLVISLAFWAWYKRAALGGQIALIVAFSAAALCNPILWETLFIVMLVFNRKAFKYNGESSECCLNKQKDLFAQYIFWIAVCVSFLLIVGWTVRNWIQLEMFAPIKSNAGYEIFQAQIASRNGVLDSSTFAYHPIIRASQEKQAYGALGETGFIRARRDMAIRSILADPIDYCRRVAQRFSNAFLFTVSPVNIALVDSRICSDDLERLRNAGFIVHYFSREMWIDLDDPDKDLIKVLPSLGLVNPQLAQDNWRLMSEGRYRYRFSWDRIIGGCLIGGMPWIALLIAILMRRRSELTPGIWWASLFLLLYLMPYVLISHYLRYQVPLLGMQAILLTAGTIALLRTLQQNQFSSTHHKG